MNVHVRAITSNLRMRFYSREKLYVLIDDCRYYAECEADRGRAEDAMLYMVCSAMAEEQLNQEETVA